MQMKCSCDMTYSLTHQGAASAWRRREARTRTAAAVLDQPDVLLIFGLEYESHQTFPAGFAKDSRATQQDDQRTTMSGDILEPLGQISANASTTPMIKPPTIAPGTLPKPPTTAAETPSGR
jgi:hypothetical protein